MTEIRNIFVWKKDNKASRIFHNKLSFNLHILLQPVVILSFSFVYIMTTLWGNDIIRLHKEDKKFSHPVGSSMQQKHHHHPYHNFLVFIIVVKDEPDGMQYGIQHQFIVHANRIIIIIIFIKQMLRDDMLPLFMNKSIGNSKKKWSIEQQDSHRYKYSFLKENILVCVQN